MTLFDQVFVTPTSGTETKGAYALQQPSSVGTTLVRGFDDADRWDYTYKQYEEYAITGMKIRWIPSNFRGTMLVDSTTT